MLSEFKPVPGYEGIFEVSSAGVVQRLFKGRGKVVKRRLRGYLDKDGYLKVCLSVKQVRKYCFVHRLVAMTFISNPLNKGCVNHINGVKLDNRVENLEWCTVLENNRHALNTGLRFQPPGELHHMSKITNAQRESIIDMYRAGHYTQKQLGIKFGLSQTQVGRIVRKSKIKSVN